MSEKRSRDEVDPELFTDNIFEKDRKQLKTTASKKGFTVNKLKDYLSTKKPHVENEEAFEELSPEAQNHVLCSPCVVSAPRLLVQAHTVTMGPGMETSIQEFLQSTFAESDAGTMTIERKCKKFCHFYSMLANEEKREFLRVICHQYGVNQNNVIDVAQHVIISQEKGDATLLMVEERLRNALTPKYKQLFSQIGRLEGGVKFLVDMRADVLSHLTVGSVDQEGPYFRALNNTLRELLALWFSVGFLHLQRVTWKSPCDMVHKISEYEAVHPIRNWSDLKRRVGPYRRCFVFIHNSMPREPVVVLHTALANQISDSIHSIVSRQFMRSGSRVGNSEDHINTSSTDLDTDAEDPSTINAAVFYSITSTQRGLQGVDLGNYLIKRVVREVQAEFPWMHQFSSLSPIPGFKDWLVTEINKFLHLKDIGEFPSNSLFTEDELNKLRIGLEDKGESSLMGLKRTIQTCNWSNNEYLCGELKTPLLRLCARYLYLEKRRGLALNPVANFHLGNGAIMWRVNWMADVSQRGLSQSCGMMVNYRYFLDQTEENSRRYLEEHHIETSSQVLDLANMTSLPPSPNTDSGMSSTGAG